MMALVLFVFITNNTFAQSTYATPYVGAEQIYKWNSVTAASYAYVVTSSSTNPTTNVVANDESIYTVSEGSLEPLGDIAGVPSADLGLIWKTAAVGHTYYVWLVAKSADDCENWRFVTVVPKANQVDFVLAALGIFSRTESIDVLKAAVADNGGTGCPLPALRDGAIYDSNSATDGFVYAYFSVSQGTSNNVDTWTFDFDVNAGTIEYYNGTVWAAYTVALTGIANEATQLLRVKIPTPIATDDVTKIIGTITAAAEETTGLLDTDVNNDKQEFVVNRVAAIGAFSGL